MRWQQGAGRKSQILVLHDGKPADNSADQKKKEIVKQARHAGVGGKDQHHSRKWLPLEWRGWEGGLSTVGIFQPTLQNYLALRCMSVSNFDKSKDVQVSICGLSLA